MANAILVPMPVMIDADIERTPNEVLVRHFACGTMAVTFAPRNATTDPNGKPMRIE